MGNKCCNEAGAAEAETTMGQMAGKLASPADVKQKEESKGGADGGGKGQPAPSTFANPGAEKRGSLLSKRAPGSFEGLRPPMKAVQFSKGDLPSGPNELLSRGSISQAHHKKADSNKSLKMVGKENEPKITVVKPNIHKGADGQKAPGLSVTRESVVSAVNPPQQLTDEYALLVEEVNESESSGSESEVEVPPPKASKIEEAKGQSKDWATKIKRKQTGFRFNR